MATDVRDTRPRWSATGQNTDARPEVRLWQDLFFWLTLALTAFAVAPFLLPGYFWGANDARHHVYFLFEYLRLVEDGIWWPRWSPDFAFGYGYPFFNIYGPFSHFLAALLVRFAGFGYTGAIEAVFVLSILGSAAAMYGFVRTWAGRYAAVLAALVYVYVPYHLLNLYVRANLAESMAFVWLPLCLWGVRAAILRPGFWPVVGCAVSYAGLMVTSNLVIVLFTPLLGLYLLVLAWVYAEPAAPRFWTHVGAAIRRGLPAALGLLAGLGLSAVFWLPMALERQYVRVDQWYDGRYDFRGHFVYFFQLFSPRWGYGVSTVGPDDPIGFQLGPVPLLLVAVGVYLVWRQAGRLRWELAVFLAAGVVATLLSLQWAAPLWELPVIGSVLGFAQFPWRWLSITALCLGVLGGLPLYGARDPARGGIPLALVALAAVVVMGSYGLLRVEISEPAEGPVGLAALMRFQQSSDEMTGSTAWVKEIPTWSPMADEYITKERAGEPVTPVASMVDYTTLNYNQETGFVVNSEARTTISEEVWYWSPLEGRRIVFNHFYYPGWNAYLLDGRHGTPVQKLPIIPEEEGTLGRMTVPVPAGEGYVLLRFEDTPPRTVGRIISLATAAVLAAVGLFGWWQRRQEKVHDN
jgi:hypothetical protein